ncbi:hypothetical protein J2X31_003568 [Flavobacterium arsenatis]|uniref:Uncharacterized protein n=1 Tax=Flavobacterium arsenatis TaxID=1484332 RepID=A0ABU1TUL3_9FLAO|nr:hypothetical protein [Flavobacterium arsenatis]MDR6969535.1 hypothetical protein [Flavobacterium arsenatis]
MQLSKFTKRLLTIFLLFSILFFCGFYYMMITKEIIPAFKNENSTIDQNSLQYSIAEVRVYKNNHFKKEEIDVSHQYKFALTAQNDSIVYANSEYSNGIYSPPNTAFFSTENSPFIPVDKMNSTFQLTYRKDVDVVLSSFPAFQFVDYLPKRKDFGNYYSKQVEVKQVSTDGKMMIYMVLKFQYDN